MATHSHFVRTIHVGCLISQQGGQQPFWSTSESTLFLRHWKIIFTLERMILCYPIELKIAGGWNYSDNYSIVDTIFMDCVPRFYFGYYNISNYDIVVS